jgi:hypothetical protein
VVQRELTLYVNLQSKDAILILGKNGLFAQTAAPSHAVCLITVSLIVIKVICIQGFDFEQKNSHTTN